MGAYKVLLLMLAAVFVTAGVHHLLIWMRNTLVREHLWFGATSLAAAGAAAATSVPDLPVEQPLSLFFAMLWVAAAAWFTLECTGGGDDRRRRAAWVATALLAAVCVGDMALPEFPGWMRSSLRALAAAALAIVFWLAIDGALRLWSSERRVRAAALGGIGIVLCLVALQGVLPDREFPQLSLAALYAFLIVVVLMGYEVASVLADAGAVSQRQRQELAHASRLSVVGELTASIAHEINQPLGAILSNADAGEILLENPDPPLDEIRKILSDIRRDGLRASDVIRHVRRLVRRRELELEKLDANAVMADVIALLEPEARQRRISVASVPSPQPANLRGDRALMEQLLINLILNAMDAVKAMSATGNVPSTGSPIVVSVSTTNHGEIEFHVVDAGAGIPTERLSHLFDSFYTSKSHGMGLGLSIARSIVEAHGGRIRAENNREGGAKFRVTLPPYDERHE